MPTQPNKTKYRKYFKPRGIPNISTKTQKLNESNSFALIAIESGFLNVKQIEAARQNIRRKVKREGKLQILAFPDIAISKKASAARMGKGKGKVDHWVVPIKAGRPVLILYGIDAEQGIPALQSGSKKLPMKLKISQL
ncbi:unnamed protein product [Pylaiella littoralis]